MILLDIQDRLYNLLENHFGATFATCVFITAVILTAIIWLSIWLYKMVHLKKYVEKLPCAEHKAKLERVIAVETKLDSLPCAEHMEQIRHHEEGHSTVLQDLSSIKTSIGFMQKGIDGLGELMQKKGVITSGIFTQSHSPLSITDEGEKMMERLGVRAMFDNNWGRIKVLIDGENESRNPYDIQQFCIQQAVVFPEKFLSESELDKIKIDAYNTGTPLLSYMRVIAVLARDRYFEENGIDVSEVDANDPTKH